MFVVTSFALLVELRLSTDNGLLLYVINLRIQGHLRLYISDATYTIRSKYRVFVEKTRTLEAFQCGAEYGF